MPWHEKYPDKPMVIAGNDDKHLKATQGVNPSRSKAEEAARAVGGKQAANPKGFTAFNDLATRSVLGQEGIARQVRSVVNSRIHRPAGSPEREYRHSSPFRCVSMARVKVLVVRRA